MVVLRGSLEVCSPLILPLEYFAYWRLYHRTAMFLASTYPSGLNLDLLMRRSATEHPHLMPSVVVQVCETLLL